MKDERIRHDISIIRPLLHNEDIKIRGCDLPASRLRDIRKSLRILHSLELMAVNIYRFQVTKEPSNLNRQLIAAACNEMTHYQDFQVKLLEYGFKADRFRWLYWIAGAAIGLTSRLAGTRAGLKTAIWVEQKAVAHYDELLTSVEWDEDTRRVIEKNQSDEYGHINRWKRVLESNKG